MAQFGNKGEKSVNRNIIHNTLNYIKKVLNKIINGKIIINESEKMLTIVASFENKGVLHQKKGRYSNESGLI